MSYFYERRRFFITHFEFKMPCIKERTTRNLKKIVRQLLFQGNGLKSCLLLIISLIF